MTVQIASETDITSSADKSTSPVNDEDEDDGTPSPEMSLKRRQRKQKTTVVVRDEHGFIIGEKEDDRAERKERRARRKAWKEAQRARYVRTMEPREFEIELSVSQMFDGMRPA